MNEDTRSFLNELLLPERINRLQFFLFYVVASLLAYLMSLAAPPFWFIFYLISIFFYLRYARARVNDWEGDVKHWVTMLSFCFLGMAIGVFSDGSTATITVFTAASAITFFISNIILLLKAGNGTKKDIYPLGNYYMEKWALKRKLKKRAREEEIKKLRMELANKDKTKE